MNYPYIYILIFVILCAYIFGLVLVAVFERKVGPMLDEKIAHASASAEHFVSVPASEEVIVSKSYEQDANKEKEKKETMLNSSEAIAMDPNRKLDRDIFQVGPPAPVPVPASVPDLMGYNSVELESTNKSASWSFEQEKMDVAKTVCFEDHEHGGACTYGVTRYPDPRTASPIEKRAFTLNYPSGMTLQDYVNWLYCFIGRETQLPYNHLKNLEKLKRKIPLKPQEGVLPPPGYYYPSMNSQQYFEKLYDTSSPSQPLITPPPLNSTTSSMLPSNYDQYSEFHQNFDVYGLSGKIVNPDIYLKKSAKAVDNVTIPKNSNEMEQTNLYTPYFKKDVEM